MASKILTNGTLIQGKGEDRKNVTVNSLEGEGKIFGLYFSAHWCPPCRGFTPKLAEWYNKLKQGQHKEKFEIVFVSSDRDEKSFNEYFDSMPWLALPFSERDLKAELSSKYKVTGIPTFILLDAKTGNVVTKNGRSIVAEDPNHEDFPWFEPTLEELLKPIQFVNNKKETKSFSDFQGKSLMIYFSAHWCPPCRGFTPKLAKFHTENSKDKNFEIIFVSSDRDQASYDEYLGTMPWYAVPFDQSKVKNKLNQLFEVEGIPSLVVLDENLKKITDNGRSNVEADPEAKEFPWPPKPLDVLNGQTASYINDRKVMLYITDGTKPQVDEGRAKMSPVAVEYFDKNKDNEDSIVFLVAEGDDLDKSLQQFINVKDSFPKLVLIDVGEGKKYVNEGDIDVAKFLKDFEEKKIASKGIRD